MPATGAACRSTSTKRKSECAKRRTPHPAPRRRKHRTPAQGVGRPARVGATAAATSADTPAHLPAPRSHTRDPVRRDGAGKRGTDVTFLCPTGSCYQDESHGRSSFIFGCASGLPRRAHRAVRGARRRLIFRSHGRRRGVRQVPLPPQQVLHNPSLRRTASPSKSRCSGTTAITRRCCASHQQHPDGGTHLAMFVARSRARSTSMRTNLGISKRTGHARRPDQLLLVKVPIRNSRRRPRTKAGLIPGLPAGPRRWSQAPPEPGHGDAHLTKVEAGSREAARKVRGARSRARRCSSGGRPTAKRPPRFIVEAIWWRPRKQGRNRANPTGCCAALKLERALRQSTLGRRRSGTRTPTGTGIVRYHNSSS